MDIKTQEMDGVMEDMYQGSISQDEVANLLDEVKGAVGIEQAAGMQGVGTGAIAGPAQANPAQGNDVDAMQKRLDDLKNL